MRDLGFPLQRRPVELKRNQIVRREISLEGAQAARGSARRRDRNPYERFETNRRLSINGLFLTRPVDREAPCPEHERALLFHAGVRIVGDGPDAKVVNARGNCYPNVVVDYMQYQEINLIPPSLIAGIEAYPTTNGAPKEFTNLCGLIRIWVKR